MKLKIFLILLVCLVTVTAADFPIEPLKQKYFDILNSYIDTLNGYFFQVNGNIQSRFDNNVAAIWQFWRVAQIFSNVYGFALAGENRTELTDCISSFSELISKVTGFLSYDIMKMQFDVKNSNTKIEDDLSSHFDEMKDAIIKVKNLTCLANVLFNDYYLSVAYQPYRTALQVGFNDILWRTGADYAGRFNFDYSIAFRNLVNMRSAIMTARTRNDLKAFIVTYCKPSIFAKFEKVIDTSTDVITGSSKAVYDLLNEAIEKLPAVNPFLSKFNACL